MPVMHVCIFLVQKVVVLLSTKVGFPLINFKFGGWYTLPE
jgi:hypothetical protein